MISFVIPAFNEESIIADTIYAIKKHGPEDNYEIIVSDNGSIDATRDIATKFGATVTSSNKKTIAGVRNDGVKQANGDILIFVDADVQLTQQWQNAWPTANKELKEDPMQITGSRCHPPQNGYWLNTYWFKLMIGRSTSYINSGHMITTRQLFEKVNGFTEHLKTAEDHDFCQKALFSGAKLNENSNLVAVHDGYPTSLKQFITRERWHGKEDFLTFKSILSSKVALVATTNLILLLLSWVMTLITFDLSYLLIYCPMLICFVLLTKLKYKPNNLKTWLINSYIHMWYFWGRSLSLIDRIIGKSATRIREQG